MKFRLLVFCAGYIWLAASELERSGLLMPVTASGAASDVLAADVQIFLCV
jgi:hypothetical protein